LLGHLRFIKNEDMKLTTSFAFGTSVILE
jgi:hypothetical protein